MPIVSGATGSSASGLLASVAYGPNTLTTYSVSNTSGLTALDTTNLTVSFTVPTSGNVVVMFSASVKTGTAGDIGFGLLNHSGGAQLGVTLSNMVSALATNPVIRVAGWWYLTGLSAGTLGIDAAAGVSSVAGGNASVYAMGNTGAVSDAKAGPATLLVWASP